MNIRWFEAVWLALAVSRLPALPAQRTQPSLELKAPIVELKVSPEYDSVQQNKDFSVFVLIDNKSDKNLVKPAIKLLNTGFGVEEQVLPDIAPFGSAQPEIKGHVDPQQTFSSHRLTFVLTYTWVEGGKPYSSTQSASTTLQVSHPFEDEMKGLPGGSGALLYLLIPVLPVFFTYHIVDSLRQGRGFQIPEFKTDYLLPSFLIAIGLNFLAVANFKQGLGESYSDPLMFGMFMGGSALAGAAVPGLGWLYQKAYWQRYAFHAEDKVEDYLRKALRGAQSTRFQWVKGKYEGQSWQGFLLHQPDHTCVLGAQLEISTGDRGEPSYEALKKLVGDWIITDRSSLLKLIQSGKVNVQLVNKVTQNREPIDKTTIVLSGTKSFSPDESELKPIIQVTS